MDTSFVAVLMGSESDLTIMQHTLDTFETMGVNYEVNITSAHRTPDATLKYIKSAEQRGCKVFICAAGMAAHLAGMVAANSLKPVIGIPISASLNGLDALLSTVQMPAGIPVATVALDKAGAKNAAYLATQILALEDVNFLHKLAADRQHKAEQIASKNKELQRSRNRS